MNIIQLGACVGDDHVTQFYTPDNKLILVEANIYHIPTLREKYPDAYVINAAVVPSDKDLGLIEFYYSTLDGPRYEVASTDRNHILKHGLADATIASFLCPTVTLSQVLNSAPKHIDILFVDIEGIDEEVIMDTDLFMYDIDKIQVEMIHLKNRDEFIFYMKSHGYELTDQTYDCGYDQIFVRQ